MTEKQFACESCGTIENGRRPRLKLCVACYAKHKNVHPECGKCGAALSRKRIAGLSADRNRVLYCSRKCLFAANSGKNHSRYKGGKITDANGYVKVRCGRKYIQEHRVVMEASIGRKLQKWETVHHKDGDRLNNRIENLELMGTRHPRGQFFDDWVDLMMSRIVSANPRCLAWRHDKGNAAMSMLITVTNVDSGQSFTLPLH